MTLEPTVSIPDAEMQPRLAFASLTAPERLDDGRVRFVLGEQTRLRSVNGGYLAAIGLRAAAVESRRRGVLSVATDFLRPVAPGEVFASVRRLHSGLNADVLEVSLEQGGKARAVSRIWMCDPQPGQIHRQGQMPLVPHPEELKVRKDYGKRPERPLPAFWTVFDQRPINRTPENRDRQFVHPRFLRWFRYVEGAKGDDMVVAVARTLPIIDMHGVASATQMYEKDAFSDISPTVQLTVQFRDLTYDGEWLLCDAICEYAGGGVTSTDVKIWGLRGELVAQGISQMLGRSATSG